MKQKSESVPKPAPPDRDSDARTVRTRANIDQAFVALLFTRPYLAIRVSDICKKADVGRATFYAHYKSKDLLLQSQLTRIIMPLLRPRPTLPWLLNARDLFAHVRTAPQLFRSIMGGGEGSGARAVRAAMQQRLDEILLDQLDPPVNVPTQLVKLFVISTLLTVALHGLRPHASESADDMQSQFEKLVGAGLSA